MPEITDPALLRQLGGAPRQQPTGPISLGGPDPMKPLQRRAAEMGIAKTSQDMGAQSQLTPFQVAKARADASKAQSEAKKAQMESGLDPQKLANIRAAQAQIDRLGYLFNKGPGRTSGLRGLLDYMPSPENKQFDTAGAGLGEVGLAAFRVPGVGSQSDAELKAFIMANRPSAGDYDTVIQEKIGNLQNRLNQTYQSYKMKRPPAQNFKDGPKTLDFNDLPE